MQSKTIRKEQYSLTPKNLLILEVGCVVCVMYTNLLD
jgi:hypothetical protein